MGRGRVTLSLGAVWLLALAGVVRADAAGDKVAAALRAAPPALTMTVERQKAVAAMDAWIAQPLSEQTQPLISYYQAAIDRALDTLERERITSGVRIFQLYSSSVIVQTPETVFAFDLDQGPNEDLTKTAAEEGVAFRLTEAQIARLAKLVQYSFHTHEHADHFDRQLTEALLDAGKTVIVTESNKANAKEKYKFRGAEKLLVLPQTVAEPVAVGPLKVDVLGDHQWGNALHTSGMSCNAYVVTTPGGVTVMDKGDINCGLQLLGWLTLLKERGQHVDAVVGGLVFWKGPNTLAQWNKLFEPLWLPGHAWEFVHRSDKQPQGNCRAYFQEWELARQLGKTEKVQVLTWGEWLDLPAR